MHHGNFQEVAWVLQNHEQRIAINGVVSDRMTQLINDVIQDNQDKSLWIGILKNEAQAQAQVIQQHQVKQQVLAEVMKVMINKQQEQEQAAAVGGRAGSEVEEITATRLDFRTYQNPNATPPGSGLMNLAIEFPQVPGSMEIEEQH